MSKHFDPRSPDSMFSTIIYRLDQQDKILLEILAEGKKTNGRCTKLEQLVAVLRGQKAVVVSLALAAGAMIAWATDVILTVRH